MSRNKKNIDQDINNAEQAIQKAKESGQKALEGGKEFGKGVGGVVLGTAEALGNIIKAGYELSSAGVAKVINKINEKNDTNIPQKNEKDTQKHIEKAGKSVKKVGKGFQNLGTGIINTAKGIAKGIGQGVKSGFHIADAGDKRLGKKVKNSEINNEKIKKATEIGASNIFKALYIGGLATLLTLGGKGIAEKISNKDNGQQNNIENIINVSPDNNTIDIQAITENPHRNNPDYFDDNKQIEIDNQYKDQGITLIRDVGMTFYVITTDDIQYDEIIQKNGKKTKKASRTKTINHLRKKLGAIPEFNYLNKNEYEPKAGGRDVTKTFNIRTDFDSYVKKYPDKYYIPIPMNSADRKINDKAFYYYANEGISEICNDSTYGDYWKKIIEKIPEEKIVKFITAIAKVETGATTCTIGTDEYHRRETGSHNCYSFGPHHVLMEESGKDAYVNLVKNGHFSTEGQLYHPKNSSVWVSGYIAEKSNLKSEKMIKILSFLNKDSDTITPDDLRSFAEFYNGSKYEQNDYHTKFCKAYKNISKNI